MLKVTTAVLLSVACANGLAKDLSIGLPDPSSPIVLLPTPGQPTVSLSGSTAVVNWAAVSLANRYYVQPIKNGVVQADVIAALPFGYLVTAGTSYQFKVKACTGRYDDTGPIVMSTGATAKRSVSMTENETCSNWSVASAMITVPAAPVTPPVNPLPGGVTYLHTDVLGSVIAESDANGNIIKKTDYKPFGQSKDN